MTDTLTPVDTLTPHVADPEANRRVFLVTFDPLGDGGGVGGFDWHPNEAVARARFRQLVAEREQDQADGEPGHRIRLWDANVVAGWSNDQVTDYLDDTFIASDPDGFPIEDTDPISDTDALTLAIFALNTLADPNASDQSDVDRLDALTPDVIRALVAMRDRIEASC